MQLEAWVLVQLCFHLGRLVGGVQRENSPPDCFLIRFTVEHQMHVTTRGHGLVDLPQKFQELLGAMAGHAIADDLARFHIQRGEQRGRAVPLIIVCHGGCAPLLERQTGLRPIQRLDLRLLINTQNHSPIRWIKVETDDIRDLFLEQRVIRDLEPLREMRLQASFGPFGGKSIPRIDF